MTALWPVSLCVSWVGAVTHMGRGAGANFWPVSPVYVFILESYERRQALWRSVVKELRWLCPRLPAGHRRHWPRLEHNPRGI